jgi:hypothetical protein
VLGCEGGFNQEEEEDIVLSMEIKMSLFAVKRELFIRPYLIIPCAQLSEALSLSLSCTIHESIFHLVRRQFSYRSFINIQGL